MDFLKTVKPLHDGSFEHKLRVYCYKILFPKINLVENLKIMQDLGVVYDLQTESDGEFVFYRTMYWGEIVSGEMFSWFGNNPESLCDFLEKFSLSYPVTEKEFLVVDEFGMLFFRFPELCFSDSKN